MKANWEAWSYAGQKVALALVALLLVLLAWLAAHLPAVPVPNVTAKAVTARPVWPVAVPLDPSLWNVLKGGRSPSGKTAGSNPLNQRYRLVGTFFAFAEQTAGAANAAMKRAVIDDLRQNQQRMLREQDTLDEFMLKEIRHDRVILTAQGQDQELLLSFGAGAEPPAAKGPALAPNPTNAAPGWVVTENKFGKRVAENRWVMKKEALKEYYDEMRNDPERLAALYLTFKPDYNNKQIAGYTIDVEGEGEFLKAAGLQQGDVVRQVNSMNMTSQRRAEYFISEFGKDRISAIVLDIERQGKPQKLIYLIR